jgi:hypothetical protein
MDNKSKILLAVIVLVVAFSVGYTFYKTIIKGDFPIVNTTEESGEGEETFEVVE